MKRKSEAWKVNNVINLTLLDCIDDSYFNDSLGQKNSDLLEQFAHIHQFRMLWLNQNAPELFVEFATVFPEHARKSNLMEALRNSGEAMTKMIEMTFEDGRVNGFNSPGDFLNYIISCESVYRNKIVMMLM
jgi:hypothetical protein